MGMSLLEKLLGGQSGGSAMSEGFKSSLFEAMAQTGLPVLEAISQVADARGIAGTPQQRPAGAAEPQVEEPQPAQQVPTDSSPATLRGAMTTDAYRDWRSSASALRERTREPEVLPPERPNLRNEMMHEVSPDQRRNAMWAGVAQLPSVFGLPGKFALAREAQLDQERYRNYLDRKLANGGDLTELERDALMAERYGAATFAQRASALYGGRARAPIKMPDYSKQGDEWVQRSLLIDPMTGQELYSSGTRPVFRPSSSSRRPIKMTQRKDGKVQDVMVDQQGNVIAEGGWGDRTSARPSGQPTARDIAKANTARLARERLRSMTLPERRKAIRDAQQGFYEGMDDIRWALQVNPGEDPDLVGPEIEALLSDEEFPVSGAPARPAFESWLERNR